MPDAWQAAWVAQRSGVAGLSDLWVGSRLERVTTAWFEHGNNRSVEPVHLWVEFSDIGWHQLHAAGTGQDILVSAEEPYESYEMSELRGRVVVESGGPEQLDSAVGQRLRSLRRLSMRAPSMTVGLLLLFEQTSVGVINPSDELLIATWPASQWLQWGVELKA